MRPETLRQGAQRIWKGGSTVGRPSKSVRVKTGAIAGDDAAIRRDVEDKLRGENVPPEPPADLTDGQSEIFQFIVNGLVASDILGQLDYLCWRAQPSLLTGCAISTA